MRGCFRILKQALRGFRVRSLGCLHGQETAEGAAIRIALPEGRGVTGGASAQAGPVAQGIAAAEGPAASTMAPSGSAMVFHPLRARCRNAGRRISSGDSRVLPDACRQSGAGLCQPCVARDGAVEKLCAGAPDGRQACDCSTVFGRAAVAGDLTGLIVEKRLG